MRDMEKRERQATYWRLGLHPQLRLAERRQPAAVGHCGEKTANFDQYSLPAVEQGYQSLDFLPAGLQHFVPDHLSENLDKK